MAWWTDLIKIAVPAVVDMFSGKDQPAQSDQTKDDQGNLVAKPIPGKLPERKKVEPWTSMRDHLNINSGMARLWEISLVLAVLVWHVQLVPHLL